MKKNIINIIIIILIVFILFLLFKKNNIENFTPRENSVYIINLDERKDRLKQIINDFSDTFTLYRTEAVKMNPPQQGCANSFLKIVKLAKDNNLPTIDKNI